MNRENQGKVEQVKGRAKEVAGILTGNQGLEKEGSRQRAAGAAAEKMGRVRRKVGDAVADLGAAIKK